MPEEPQSILTPLTDAAIFLTACVDAGGEDEVVDLLPDLGGLRRSVGFGFRWVSPIGPLRFEWGIPLDAQPGEEPLVFEFTIGNFL